MVQLFLSVNVILILRHVLAHFRMVSSRMADLQTFQQVLSHPAFKLDPLGAISKHLKNAASIEQENPT